MITYWLNGERNLVENVPSYSEVHTRKDTIESPIYIGRKDIVNNVLPNNISNENNTLDDAVVPLLSIASE